MGCAGYPRVVAAEFAVADAVARAMREAKLIKDSARAEAEMTRLNAEEKAAEGDPALADAAEEVIAAAGRCNEALTAAYLQLSERLRGLEQERDVALAAVQQV